MLFYHSAELILGWYLGNLYICQSVLVKRFRILFVFLAKITKFPTETFKVPKLVFKTRRAKD